MSKRARTLPRPVGTSSPHHRPTQRLALQGLGHVQRQEGSIQLPGQDEPLPAPLRKRQQIRSRSSQMSVCAQAEAVPQSRVATSVRATRTTSTRRHLQFSSNFYIQRTGLSPLRQSDKKAKEKALLPPPPAAPLPLMTPQHNPRLPCS